MSNYLVWEEGCSRDDAAEIAAAGPREAAESFAESVMDITENVLRVVVSEPGMEYEQPWKVFVDRDPTFWAQEA